MSDPFLEGLIRQLAVATQGLLDEGMEMSDLRRTLYEIVAGAGLGSDYAEGQRIIEMVLDAVERR